MYDFDDIFDDISYAPIKSVTMCNNKRYSFMTNISSKHNENWLATIFVASKKGILLPSAHMVKSTTDVKFNRSGYSLYIEEDLQCSPFELYNHSCLIDHTQNNDENIVGSRFIKVETLPQLKPMGGYIHVVLVKGTITDRGMHPNRTEVMVPFKFEEYNNGVVRLSKFEELQFLYDAVTEWDGDMNIDTSTVSLMYTEIYQRRLSPLLEQHVTLETQNQVMSDIADVLTDVIGD